MTGMLISFFLHPFVLSMVLGVLVFVFTYIRLPGIMEFFKEKTLRSQGDVLKIMEMMMMATKPEKVVLWLWVMGLCLGFMVFLLLWPHFLFGLAFGAVAFLASWLGAGKIMKAIWEKRCDQVVEQMVEGLTIMTNGVKVGLSVTQSMDRVIKGMGSGPLVQEFQLALNKVHLGMSVEDALNEMGERIDRPDAMMMVTAINILKETGGNIAETLSMIADTIRDRQKVENKIKALTAMGTMQAQIISAVPLLLLVVMFFTNKQYAVLMLSTPLGWVSLGIILILIVLGGFLMKKAVTIAV